MSEDITSVIETAVAGLKDETPAETTVETAAETPESTAEVAETKPETNDEETELGQIEQELVAKEPKLRGQINVSRHQAVLTRARRQYEAQLAEAKKQLEPWQKYQDPALQARLRAFEISEQDHERFVEILEGVPQYKEILDRKVAEAIKAAQAPTKPEEPPKLEQQLREDGTLEYTPESFKKLLEFHVKQALDEQKKQYDEKFGSLEKDLEPVREHQKAVANLNDSIGRMSTKLDNARKWPGFVENEEKISALMLQKGNETLSLEEAYGRVLYTTKDQARADVVREMSEKSKATRTTLRPGLPEATAAADNGAEEDMETTIRNAMATLR